MSPLEVPFTATPLTAAEFLGALRKVLPELPIGSLCVLMAQSALETGRWKRCFNYNLAGIKSNTSVPHTYTKTREVLARSAAERYLRESKPETPVVLVEDKGPKLVLSFAPKHPVCRFRAYDSLDEGMAAYVGLLRKRFAGAWPAVENGDPTLFAKRLSELGYYTAPVEQYAASIRSLHAEYRKLG